MINPLKSHLSSLPGGAFISLACHLSVIASCDIENASVKSICASVVFCIGLLLILITGCRLFTGQIIRYSNCGCLRDTMSVSGSLVLSYIGNFIGSMILVWLFYTALPKVTNSASEFMAATAAIKLSQAPFRAFLSAIICNMCVVGSIALRQRGTHMVASLLPTAAFVMLGAEHIVADFTYLAYGFIHNTISIVQVAPFVIVVTIGNFIGGFIIAKVCCYSAKQNAR